MLLRGVQGSREQHLESRTLPYRLELTLQGRVT
jgi:hypothetical protein